MSKKDFLANGAETTKAAPIVRDLFCLSPRQLLGSEQQVFSESGLAEVHSLREKAVREDIARRLGTICSNFSEAEFETLVAVMAARQVKGERGSTW